MILPEKSTAQPHTEDYYPFGLSFNQQTRENTQAQNYLYNGKELQTDLDLNWTDYGARMYDASIGRFMRIDRFTEKYMPLSPYNYVANNPILNVDINGDYITIMGEDDDGNRYSVLYQNGRAYHYTKDKDGKIKRGKVYDGKNEFIKNTVADLNKIGTTREGGKAINRLTSSSSGYGINKARSFSNSKFEPNKNSKGLTSGGNIYSSQEKKFLDGVSFKGVYNLGHELYHAYQRDLGAKGYWALVSQTGKDGYIPLAEIQAVGFENYLRASLDEVGYNSVRQTYTKKAFKSGNITPIELKEFRNRRGWKYFGWSSPWDISDFINRRSDWLNLRKVAMKKYTSD